MYVHTVVTTRSVSSLYLDIAVNNASILASLNNVYLRMLSNIAAQSMMANSVHHLVINSRGHEVTVSCTVIMTFWPKITSHNLPKESRRTNDDQIGFSVLSHVDSCCHLYFAGGNFSKTSRSIVSSSGYDQRWAEDIGITNDSSNNNIDSPLKLTVRLINVCQFALIFRCADASSFTLSRFPFPFSQTSEYNGSFSFSFLAPGFHRDELVGMTSKINCDSVASSILLCLSLLVLDAIQRKRGVPTLQKLYCLG